jgi:exopolysaccharide biosynthesis polyprenyl glycosylphosphotransferase
MPDRSKSLTLWLLALPTVLFFYFSLFLVIRIWYPQGLDPNRLLLHVAHFSVVLFLWMVVFFMLNVFETRYLQQTGALAINLASAMAVNLFVAVAYFYFQPSLIITPRRFLLLHVVLTGLMLLGWHVFIQRLFRRYFVENLYLFLPDRQDKGIVSELTDRPSLGFRIKGVLTADEFPRLELAPAAGLIIPEAGELSPEELQLLYALRGRTARFYSYRQIYETLHRKIYLLSLTELWFLENVNYREKRVYSLVKRLIDIVVGLAALTLTLVLYPFVAVAVKLDSSGPVLFRQERVGKYGKIIVVYKFRSMATGDGNPANTWTGEKDSRITRVGRVMRRLRLDELPQFWNLVSGSMSVVGPRPEQPNIVKQLRVQIPFYDERHLVKPGLTGWGQLNVYARTVEQSKTKLQYDLYYIKHRSLLFDLEIILKTLYHVVTTGGV